MPEELKSKGEIVFYDSISTSVWAPRGRSMEEFVKESMSHGWPSFRDEEVVADNVSSSRWQSRIDDEYASCIFLIPKEIDTA